MKRCVIAVIACLALLVASGSSGAAATKRVLGPHQWTEATAYGPCDGSVGVGLMAYGLPVYWGAIASNFLPSKTLVRVDKPILGRRIFRVEDTGANFDVWMVGCQNEANFGRRQIGYRVYHRVAR